MYNGVYDLLAEPTAPVPIASLYVVYVDGIRTWEYRSFRLAVRAKRRAIARGKRACIKIN